MNSIKDKIKKISKWFFGTKKRKLIFSLLLVLLIIAPLSFYLWNKSAQADWWNSDWNYRRSITINSAQIPADLTNYPMLVSFTDSNLINKTQTDGGDIIFIQENGTRLDHEIEKFDNTTGELVAWVKIPQLEGDYDTTLYMYYGNQTVDNQQRPEDVWDDGFKTVQHLEEGGTGTRYDSTRSNKDGTPVSYEGTEATTGKIGGADDFDGTNNIDLGTDIFSSADIVNGSMSAWVKADILDSSEKMVVTIENYVALYWGDYMTSSDFNFRSYIHTGSQQVISTTSMNTGEYVYLTMTWDGVNMRLYKNGVLVDTDTVASPSVADNRGVRIGSDHAGYATWDGIIDEVRISNSARSANWITTEYNNQNSPSTFISLGQEERGFSPALYLPFDEGFGTTAHDETSNHNDGSIVGATWKDESNCKSGKCLEFDGTGDYVEINDNKSLDLSEEVTLEAWVKPQSTTPNNQTIISKVETPTDPTKIFRSVGPSATGALATGTATNHLTIVGDRAVFAEATPSQVGVGDAIQYDDDDDGDIDTNDSIVFIKQRVTSYEFLVATATGGVPTAVVADTNWSLFRAYTSLYNAENSTENTGIDADLVNFDTWSWGKDITASNEEWNIVCYNDAVDATSVIFDDWTTGIHNYINIYTPVNVNEVGVSQRHNGTWGNGYRRTEQLLLRENYMRVDGVSIQQADNCAGEADRTFFIYNFTGVGNIELSNNFGQITHATTGCDVYDVYSVGSITVKMWNNIGISNSTDVNSEAFFINDVDVYAYLYNNTGKANGGSAFKRDVSTYISAINNLGITTAGGTGDFTGYFNLINNNASSDATADDWGGSNNKINQTFAFIDYANNDLHLAPTDTAAKNSGADLSYDSFYPIANDIDGQSRLNSSLVTDYGLPVTNFDIGADEARATQIYRSVAPSKTDALETGDGNAMTITGNIAVFAKAMPSQVGVGDVIQYDDDNDSDIDANDSLVFISGRVSSYEFLVTTASGGVPTQVINDNDWSLFRAYTSLANAESGTENTSIDSDLRNFDSWTGGKDLVTSKEQWNIACYANGTTADTTTTIVNGWTTGELNFVRIYTPVSESEVGVSQRHNGKWDVTKYIIDIPSSYGINVEDPHIKIDGLQIDSRDSTSASIELQTAFDPGVNTFLNVSNNIFWGNTGTWSSGVYISDVDLDYAYLYNNIAYDFKGGEGQGFTLNGNSSSLIYAYNNTVFNCTHGLRTDGTGVTIRNNLIKGSDPNDSFVGNFVTSSNNINNDSPQEGAFGDTAETGATSGVATSKLIDGTQNFLTTVRIGMIVANTTDNTYTYVTAVDSNTQLSVANDIFASGENYNIYSNRYGAVSFANEGNDDFHLSKTDTVARNAGTNLSTDTNLPINSDIDGESRSTQSAFDIGADEAVATKIYRSVGPGNTTTLATDENHENSVVVSSGIASFSANIPDNVGIGDAVLIDTNADNSITSADTLLFIHSRTSSTVYTLRTHTGSVPGDISVNDTYQILRAYTSLANAESGTKNTSIPITFNGGNRDLVTNNEEWNIACYGDGVDTAMVNIDSWTTGVENNIKVYTPNDSSEVGISQRHSGKWDNNKYRLEYTTTATGQGALAARDDYIFIEGLQILLKGTYADSSALVAGANNIVFANNIIKSENTGLNATGIITGASMKAFNNIIYDFSTANSSAFFTDWLYTNYNYWYNNTIYNCTVGFDLSGNGIYQSGYLFNNIASNCSTACYVYSGASWPTYNNISSDGTADDGGFFGNRANQSTSFRDASNDDFRLAMTDITAKGLGLNAYNSNPSLGFVGIGINSDIEGELRPSLRQGSGVAMPSSLNTNYLIQNTSFDIGADQISSTIHNNYSLNLKTNYPQANFSTADNDKDNFSSGDMNLEANTWSHIAYKRSNDIEELYINGSKKDSSTISNFLKTNNGKLYLGSNNTSSKNSFKGLLDEIKIYPYARTESEIKKDKVAGSSGRAASRAQEGIGVSIGDQASNLSDGLVGYWKMDETSWTGAVNEVRDVSGNNNHGIRLGNATTGAGKFGNGGVFDGNNDSVDIDMEMPARAYTKSAWVVRRGAATYPNILSEVGGAVFWAQDNSYKLAAGHSAPFNDVNDVNSLELNRWYNVVVSYDPDISSGTMVLYKDGVEIDRAVGVGLHSTGNNVRIARYNTFEDVWNGNIDEVRLYNRALNGNEIQQLYNYAPGPVLHLKMDEKSGTTAYDSSGNNNNGAITGATWDTGKNNGATKFVNDTDQVLVNQSSSINNLKSFTYGAWVNSATTGVGSRRPIIEKGSGSDIKKTLTFGDHTGSSKRRVMLEVNTNGTTGEITTVNDTYGLDTWEYWTFTYDDYGTRIPRLYKNGIEVQYASQVAATGTIDDDSARDLAMGSSPGTNFYAFDGSIDDVKVYNYVRTQEQILEDMSDGAGSVLGGGAGALKKPILDLSFNEGQGATAYDASGNGNSGTLNARTTGGNTTTTAMWDKGGKFGGAIEFDGTNDSVEITNATSFDSTDNTFSVWIKPNVLGNAKTIMDLDFDEQWLGIHEDQYNIYGRCGDHQYGTPILNTWQHIVWTVKGGGDYNLYLNGERIGTGSGCSASVNADMLIMGRTGSSEHFNGLMDDARFYNYVLSEDEVIALYNDSSAMVMGGDESRNNNGTEVTGANKDYCVPGDSAVCNKPVLELKMDEKSGTTVYDTSGNGNNGTFVNSPIWDRGKFGSGINFNGSNSYLNLGASSTLNMYNSNYTLQGWIYLKSHDPSYTDDVFARGDYGCGHDFGISGAMGSTPNRVYLHHFGAGAPESGFGNTDVSLNSWHHVAISYDNTSHNGTFYLDGKMDGQTNINAMINCVTRTSYVGIDGRDILDFVPDGNIDEVKIYNYARTPAQIAWDYNHGKEINHWKFDEGSGPTVHDEGPNQNTGTITGATWKNESECKDGKCLYFNGLDLTRVDMDTQDNMSQFTACAWINPKAWDNPNNEGEMYIFSKGWYLSLLDDGKIDFARDTSAAYPRLMTNDSISINEWSRVCGVYKGVSTSPEVYINGNNMSGTGGAGSGTVIDESSFILRIGANRGNEYAYNFYGYIDDPKIYNYALTNDQIQSDYNGGAVNFR